MDSARKAQDKHADDQPAADHAAILQRWDAFHIARTLTTFAAFVLIILLATGTARTVQSRIS